MNRVTALCAMNCAMMETFSHRTVENLKSHTLFKLALPPFRSFLELNVGKEVAKDRMVILEAARMHDSGIQPDSSHVPALLQKARQIDQSFLRRAAAFPIDIRIEHPELERYRKQRIELLLLSSHQVFSHWQNRRSFRVAVMEHYSEAQYRELLHNILTLYARETHMLSRSVRIPRLITLARDALTQTITNTMEREAEVLARSLARKIYCR